MKELVFASANAHKVEEVGKKLGGHIPVIGLKDIGCLVDIPETSDTLQGNAEMKADYIWQRYHRNCFADDTGLEVEALHGAPGVYSARYAGDQKNPADNLAKLLHEMQHQLHRKARFRTSICLIIDGQKYFFEGIVNGVITRERRGGEGFGYDPVFVPDGHSRTFAQMTIDEKNLISHRGRAIRALADFLMSKR